jgi:hypothetical protein
VNRSGYLTCFVCFGFLSLLLSQLIRSRLKKYHADLFARLGNPAFQDSNLGITYWKFQRFVLWGFMSEANDSVLRFMCVLASLSNLGVIVFFFLCV